MNAEIGDILSLVSSKQLKTKETNIWVPKPRGHFCHVCKINFEDYLEHINTPEHRKSWRESSFTFNISYFSELIGKYNPQKQLVESESRGDEFPVPQNIGDGFDKVTPKKMNKPQKQFYNLLLSYEKEFLKYCEEEAL